MRTRSRSLFLVPRYWPSTGGAQLHTRTLAQHLAEGRDVRIATLALTDEPVLERAFADSRSITRFDGATWVETLGPAPWARSVLQVLARGHARFRGLRPLFDAIARASIRSRLRAQIRKADVVHAVYNGLTFATELALELAHASGKPFVWTPLAHTALPAGTGWDSGRFRRLYPRVDALVAMTAYERDWLVARGAAPEHVEVSPIGPRVDAHPDPSGLRLRYRLGDDPVVSFLGRHVSSKGYRVLARAIPAVLRQRPSTRFVFAGPETDESRRFFEEWSHPALLRLGPLDEGAKTSLLAASSVLCVPSVEESLGGVYLEAWSQGVPVIGCPIPAVRSVVEHGGDGLLVEPRSEVVARALVQLLGDPGFARRLGERGRAKVRHRYGWDVVRRRTEAIHDRLIGSGPRGRPNPPSPGVTS